MPGPAVRLSCPYCPKTVVSQQLLKHLLSYHERETLLYEESPGLFNLRKLDPKYTTRSKPIGLDFPNKTYYYSCFGCMRCFKNSGWDSHHEKCKEKHIKELDRLWAKYKEPSLAPVGTAPVAVAAVATIDTAEREWWMALVWKAMAENIALRQDLDDETASKHHPSEYDDMPPETFQDQLLDFLGPTVVKGLKVFETLDYKQLTEAYKKHFPHANLQEEDELERVPIKLKKEARAKVVPKRSDPTLTLPEPAPEPQRPPVENVVLYREPAMLPVISNTKAKLTVPGVSVARRL